MENKVHQKPVFVQFEITNFRPFKIGKSWIASCFRPRNDEKHFRANYSLKYSSLSSLVQPTKRLGFHPHQAQNKNGSNKCLSVFIRRRWDSNPRYARTYDGFQDRSNQPLWHSSKVIQLVTILYYTKHFFL